MKRYNDRLVGSLESPEGMGGYLDPPEYPTHFYSVVSGPKYNPHNLSSIVPIAEQAPDYVDPDVILKCQTLIAAWHANRPPLDRADVQTWIADCYRHWQSCWYSDTPSDYGSHALSPHARMADGSPAKRPDNALDYALYHIRRFYPEYTPKEQ